MNVLWDVKFDLSSEFEIKDLGKASKFLSMNINRKRNANRLGTDHKNYLYIF